MQWTPGGWVVKDNYHKVTATTRAMPSADILPFKPSKDLPDVAADRTKMQMLTQNIHMMEFELQKLCQRFRIVTKPTKETDLSSYPEDQRDRLKTAIGCVTNAHKTMQDFRDFLVEEKYLAWNDEQKMLREATVKAMIGEMPKGIPHKRDLSGADGEEEMPPGMGDQAPKAKMVMDEEGQAKIVFEEEKTADELESERREQQHGGGEEEYDPDSAAIKKEDSEEEGVPGMEAPGMGGD
jgi:hypothetical protein